MPLVKICGSDTEGGALAKGMGAAMKVLGRKKKAAKEKKFAATRSGDLGPCTPSTSASVSKSEIACPDCGKDQIEHSNGFVCRCSVRKAIAK